MLYGELDGWDGVGGGREAHIAASSICIHIADSLCHPTETQYNIAQHLPSSSNIKPKQ